MLSLVAEGDDETRDLFETSRASLSLLPCEHIVDDRVARDDAIAHCSPCRRRCQSRMHVSGQHERLDQIRKVFIAWATNPRDFIELEGRVRKAD